jgi:hypothetical protein
MNGTAWSHRRIANQKIREGVDSQYLDLAREVQRAFQIPGGWLVTSLGGAGEPWQPAIVLSLERAESHPKGIDVHRSVPWVAYQGAGNLWGLYAGEHELAYALALRRLLNRWLDGAGDAFPTQEDLDEEVHLPGGGLSLRYHRATNPPQEGP